MIEEKLKLSLEEVQELYDVFQEAANLPSLKSTHFKMAISKGLEAVTLYALSSAADTINEICKKDEKVFNALLEHYAKEDEERRNNSDVKK